jgi:hypothetical protein
MECESQSRRLYLAFARSVQNVSDLEFDLEFNLGLESGSVQFSLAVENLLSYSG